MSQSQFNRSERRSRRQRLIETLRHALKHRGKMPEPREQIVSDCKDRGLRSLSTNFAPTRDQDVIKGLKGDRIYESTDTGTGMARCVTSAANKEIDRRAKRDAAQPSSPGAIDARRRYRADKGSAGALDAIERLTTDFKQVLSDNDHISKPSASNEEIKCNKMATRDACYQVRYPDTQTQKCYWEADTNQHNDAQFECSELNYKEQQLRYLDNADTEARRSGRKINAEDFTSETKPGEKFPAHPNMPSLRLAYRKGGGNKPAKYDEVSTDNINQPNKPAEREPLYRNPGAGRHLVPLYNNMGSNIVSKTTANVPSGMPAAQADYQNTMEKEFDAVQSRTALDLDPSNPVKRTAVGKATAEAVLSGGQTKRSVQETVNLLLLSGGGPDEYLPCKASKEEDKCRNNLLLLMNKRENAIKNGVQIPPRIWNDHAWPLLRKILYFVDKDGNPIESDHDDFPKQHKSVELIQTHMYDKHETQSEFAEKFVNALASMTDAARVEGLHGPLPASPTPYQKYLEEKVYKYRSLSGIPADDTAVKTHLTNNLLNCGNRLNVDDFGPSDTARSLYHKTDNIADELQPPTGAVSRTTITQRLMDTLVKAQQTNRSVDPSERTKIYNDLKSLLKSVGFTNTAAAPNTFQNGTQSITFA